MRTSRVREVFFGAAALLAWAVMPAGGQEIRVPVFEDVTEAAGIQFKHSIGDMELSNIVEGTGFGGMFLDYNGDGWLDIYVVNGRYRSDVNDNTGRRLRGALTHKLFRSNKDGTFTDVTEEAGVGGGESYGMGCSAADYDRDGDVDMYLASYGPDILYRNNGDGTFTDATKESGIDEPGWGVSGLWLDYDQDGQLDLFVTNYLEYDGGAFRNFYPAAGYPGPLSYQGQSDHLYRNLGNGRFENVTEKAGVMYPAGRGMSTTASDFTNSGLLDILVANDAMENNYFRNLGGGKFTDDALVMGLAFGEGGQGVSAMGPVPGDFNRDGLMDLYIPDMGYGCLMFNKGDHFEDVTNATGMAMICGQYTGWGGVAQDFDNDGNLDIFVANGDAHHEYGEEAVMVHNDGKGKFSDVARNSGKYFQEKLVGRGATWGDFDNDGDIDLLVCHLNHGIKLLRNDGGNELNRWLSIDARLAGGKTSALGARVKVTAGELVMIDDLIPVRGYLSQGDPRLHFGLGKAEKADKVEIRWPDGTVKQLTDVAANQILMVEQPAGSGE